MSLLSKTLRTANIGMQQTIAYKNNFLLGFLSEAFGLIVQLVFWPVFFNSGAELEYSSIENTVIAGYYVNEVMTYSILIYIIQRGTAMMNISSAIKNDIMSGELNIYIIRPVKYLWTKCISSISGQIINFVLSLGVYFCIALFGGSFLVFPDGSNQTIMVVLFVFFAYILSFLINSIIGTMSFWMLETGALGSFISMGISILSGAIFPIDFIGGNTGFILRYLPFSYLAFIPTQIYLGKIEPDQLTTYILICMFWIITLSIIAAKLWKKGLQKYSAFGG